MSDLPKLYAQGGPIFGAEASSSDTVPALLSDGCTYYLSHGYYTAGYVEPPKLDLAVVVPYREES